MSVIKFAYNDMVYIGFAVKDRNQYNYGDDPDLSLLLLNKEQLLESDSDFLFYNQSSVDNKSVILEYQSLGTGSDDQFAYIDFGSLPNHVENIKFIVTRHTKNTTGLNYDLTFRIAYQASSDKPIPSNFEHILTSAFRLESSEQTMYLFDIRKTKYEWQLSIIEQIKPGDLSYVYEQFAKK